VGGLEGHLEGNPARLVAVPGDVAQAVAAGIDAASAGELLK